MVVVAEKRVVYREFPIPLINRMEKHFLTMEGMLSDVQLKLSVELDKWAKDFSSVSDRLIFHLIFVQFIVCLQNLYLITFTFIYHLFDKNIKSLNIYSIMP